MGYFERFISRRHLFNLEKKALVSVITFISIFGVTVGVAALIIVTGVIDGIDRQIISRIIEVYPHLKITDSEGRGLAEPEGVLETLHTFDGVALAEGVVNKQVLFSTGDDRSGGRVPGRLIGVDELGHGQLYDIPGRGGTTIRLGPKQVLLSPQLFMPLEIHMDAAGRSYEPPVTVTTGILARTPNGRMPRRRKLNVIGVYQTGLFEFDQVSAFVSTDTARKVFGMASGVDYVHVKIDEPFEPGRIKERLAAALGPGYSITTWAEDNGEFFQALKLEKIGLFVILLLVVIVASFNIIGTLILMVIEKTREIGVLKSLGASERMIRGTFMNSGLTIGLLGTAAGLVIGLLGCVFVRESNLVSGMLMIEELPVVIKPVSVALIAGASILISFVAGLFPATQAARLDPVRALAHE